MPTLPNTLSDLSLPITSWLVPPDANLSAAPDWQGHDVYSLDSATLPQAFTHLAGNHRAAQRAFNYFTDLDGKTRFELIDRLQRSPHPNAAHALANYLNPDVVGCAKRIAGFCARPGENFAKLEAILGEEHLNWIIQLLDPIVRLHGDNADAEDILAFCGALAKLAAASNAPCQFHGRTWSYNAIYEAIRELGPLSFGADNTLTLIRAAFARSDIYGADILFVSSQLLAKTPDAGRRKKLLADLLRFTGALNRYVASTARDILRNLSEHFETLGCDTILARITLYADIFSQHSRQSVATSLGVQSAFECGLLPENPARSLDDTDPRSAHEIVLDFIRRTGGFLPPVFALYRERGESVLAEIRAHALAFFRGDYGLEDAKRLRSENGGHLLLAVLHRITPPLGLSRLKYEDQLRIVDSFLAKGDLSGQVPMPWRGRVETGGIEEGFWILKDGETVDPDGRVERIVLRLLRSREQAVSEDDVVASLSAYFSGNAPAGGLSRLYENLYALAGKKEEIARFVDQAKGLDYASLLLFEEFFLESDQFPAFCRELIAKLSDDVLARHLKSKEKTSGAKNECLSESERARLISRLVARLTAKPLAVIRTEMARYEFRIAQGFELGLFAAKSPGFVLYGPNADICTGERADLWEDPRYQILPILVPENGEPDFASKTNLTAQGAVQIDLPMLGGQDHFVALAFDPSVELLSRTDPNTLFATLLKQTIPFATALGHEVIYIPTNPWVHSNRFAIKRALRRFMAEHQIKTVTLPPVKWLPGSETAPGVLKEFYAVPVAVFTRLNSSPAT